jgi:hypothetical protein
MHRSSTEAQPFLCNSACFSAEGGYYLRFWCTWLVNKSYCAKAEMRRKPYPSFTSGGPGNNSDSFLSWSQCRQAGETVSVGGRTDIHLSGHPEGQDVENGGPVKRTTPAFRGRTMPRTNRHRPNQTVTSSHAPCSFLFMQIAKHYIQASTQLVGGLWIKCSEHSRYSISIRSTAKYSPMIKFCAAV